MGHVGRLSLAHWDGATWKDVAPSPWAPAAIAPPLTSSTPNAIAGLAGPSSTDLWATTRAGEVFHFDGVAWTRIAWLGVGLSSIARSPAGAIYVVGGNGAVLRRGP